MADACKQSRKPKSAELVRQLGEPVIKRFSIFAKDKAGHTDKREYTGLFGDFTMVAGNVQFNDLVRDVGNMDGAFFIDGACRDDEL